LKRCFSSNAARGTYNGNDLLFNGFKFHCRSVSLGQI
jgi:hypothetical protein